MAHNIIINGSNSFDFEIKIPADKSITHRAIIIASMCEGEIKILNPLLADDCLSTIEIMKQLGATISIENDASLTIKGKNYNNFIEPKKKLYAGNSGTLMRLISGILSMQNFSSEIFGDDSLMNRPMDRISRPLEEIGCNLSTSDGKPPIKFYPSNSKKSFKYVNTLASAQVKSCMIFAAIYLQGESVVKEKFMTRDHTERLLSYLDYPIKKIGDNIHIKGQGKISAKEIKIPNDVSSAAFFIAAALVKKNSRLVMKNINFNERRIGIIKILEKMGAKISIDNERHEANEIIVDITSEYSNLKPINISGDIISDLIDELPILFVVCALCEGVSHIKDIEELRYKESDRINSMERGLNKLGIKTESTQSSIKIHGGELLGGIVDSYGDHRVAMAFSVAALVSKKPITILNTENVSTSFPNFVDLLIEIGAEVYEL